MSFFNHYIYETIYQESYKRLINSDIAKTNFCVFKEFCFYFYPFLEHVKC